MTTNSNISIEKIRCKIISSETTDSIIDRLRSVTIEEQPFFKPKRFLFLGKINNDSFRLITFNSPPMEFDFRVLDDAIEFYYQKDSLTKTLTYFNYALMMPLLGGLWIWSLIDERVDLIGKIAFTLVLFIPLLVNMITKLIYEKFALADDEKFIAKLENTLSVKIEKYPIPL